MALEKFKRKYLEKLKRKTVISELNGEKVYLSKGSFLSFLPGIGKNMREWNQIYPAVDEETGKINWVNLLVGGKRNLVKLILFAILVTLVFLQFNELFRISKQAIECCNRCNAINLFP